MAQSEILKGTATDTQDAREQGLEGRFLRSIRVVVIGAGSNFTPRLVADLLAIPENAGGTIALVDIDETRLRAMEQLVRRMADERHGPKWNVEAAINRRDVLAGADYILVCIEVNGLACVAADNDIPLRYGVRQCIGDTIGPGGVFKGLRTIPVFLDILRDIEELCPEALVLNYTNPMAMMMLAAGRTTRTHVVGLCHSVQGTSKLLADRAGVPVEELDWECAGINHLAWFTRLRHRGQDLYPKLLELARADLAGLPSKPDDQHDLVRKDMMVQFGAFITESSPHLSEYLPYYRRRDDSLARYCQENFPGNGPRTGSRFYADMWPVFRAEADRDRIAMIEGRKPVDWKRSWEYASWIIEAREKDRPYRIHGNVMNHNGAGGTLITNLPPDTCVEVPCLVDRAGIHPIRVGALPPQMAAVCNSCLGVIDLGARAAVERSLEAATHAVMLDPLTAASCTPEEIRSMVKEMFIAERDFLPGFE